MFCVLPLTRGKWTAGVPLPGGDFPLDRLPAVLDDLKARFPFLSDDWARRLVRAYGTEAKDILGDAAEAADLGQDFGATLTEAEVTWLMSHEFARTGQDVVWRRNKLGLRMTADQIQTLENWMAQKRHATPAAAE